MPASTVKAMTMVDHPVLQRDRQPSLWNQPSPQHMGLQRNLEQCGTQRAWWDPQSHQDLGAVGIFADSLSFWLCSVMEYFGQVGSKKQSELVLLCGL